MPEWPEAATGNDLCRRLGCRVYAEPRKFVAVAATSPRYGAWSKVTARLVAVLR